MSSQTLTKIEFNYSVSAYDNLKTVNVAFDGFLSDSLLKTSNLAKELTHPINGSSKEMLKLINLIKANTFWLGCGDGYTTGALNDVSHNGLEFEYFDLSKFQSYAFPWSFSVRNLL